MITIKNLKDEKPTEPWQVKVDRTSSLGNPIIMKREDQRDNVCDMYDYTFKMKLIEKENPNNIKNAGFHQELNRLKDLHKQYGKLELFCWCAPKRCHAETIKKWLEDNGS